MSKFKVGDEVSLNPDRSPGDLSCGQGGVEYSEVGVVSGVTTDGYRIKFPSLGCWTGEYEDLVLVVAEQPKLEWKTGSWEDIPVGAVFTYEDARDIQRIKVVATRGNICALDLEDYLPTPTVTDDKFLYIDTNVLELLKGIINE